MGWVRLDDGFFRHPKVLAAGRDARDLYLAALCYCGAGLTDGLVPVGALPILAVEAGVGKAAAAVNRLVAVGLFEEVPNGWRIHDYLAHQESADSVKAARAANAARQAQWRARKKAQATAEPRPGDDPTRGGNGAVTPLRDADRNAFVTDRRRETPKIDVTPPPPPPLSRAGAGEPAVVGVVVEALDYRSLIGPETWGVITEALGAIDPQLSPAWLARELAALPAGLDRARLMAGMNAWRRVMASRLAADGRTPEDRRIHAWRVIAGRELRDAFEAVRYDD